MWYSNTPYNYRYSNAIKYYEFTLENLIELRKNPEKLDAVLQDDLVSAVSRIKDYLERHEQEIKFHLERHAEVTKLAKAVLKAGIPVDDETKATLRSMGVQVSKKKKA
jgi:hypothetical protein